jgi:hypothetical protein
MNGEIDAAREDGQCLPEGHHGQRQDGRRPHVHRATAKEKLAFQEEKREAEPQYVEIGHDRHQIEPRQPRDRE